MPERRFQQIQWLVGAKPAGHGLPGQPQPSLPVFCVKTIPPEIGPISTPLSMILGFPHKFLIPPPIQNPHFHPHKNPHHLHALDLTFSRKCFQDKL